MRTFDHVKCDFEFPKLKAELFLGSRYYRTPAGDVYPSVTTVTALESREGVAKWRARVGDEEADQVARYTRVRGEMLHSLCEKYINNDLTQDDIKNSPGVVAELFKTIQPVIDSRVGLIHAQEKPLFSDRLKLAGRVDLVAEFDGKLSIVDFKTSLQEKREEYVQKYFMQCFAYACLWQERTGQQIDDIAVIIACDGGIAQVFQKGISEKRKYIKDLMGWRKIFDKEYQEKADEISRLMQE